MLSRNEIAEVFEVSSETVRNWDKKGIIHADFHKGKRKFYSEEQIEKLKNTGIQEVVKLN